MIYMLEIIASRVPHPDRFLPALLLRLPLNPVIRQRRGGGGGGQVGVWWEGRGRLGGQRKTKRERGRERACFLSGKDSVVEMRERERKRV